MSFVTVTKKKSSVKNHFTQQPEEILETWLVHLHDKGHTLTKVTEGEWYHLGHVPAELLLQIALKAATAKRAKREYQGQ